MPREKSETAGRFNRGCCPGFHVERPAAEIIDEGGRALALVVDVTDQNQAIGAVERTVAELGRLDTLINNAGVMLLGPIVDAPTEEWDRMVALNLQGLLYTSHAALPHLLAAADGNPRRVADLVALLGVPEGPRVSELERLRRPPTGTTGAGMAKGPGAGWTRSPRSVWAG